MRFAKLSKQVITKSIKPDHNLNNQKTYQVGETS